MTEVNAFSALNFWKTIEQKTSPNAAKVSRPVPKKINFPLLQPPPPPPSQDEVVIDQKEWNGENVTGAFDFWKQKSIELKEENDKYNARRSMRNTMDFTNLLKKSSGDEGSNGLVRITTTTTTTTTTDMGSSSDLAKLVDQVHHHSIQSNLVDDNGSVISTTSSAGGENGSTTSTSEKIKILEETTTTITEDRGEFKRSTSNLGYRRSRSISCEILPVISSTTTEQTQTTLASTVPVETIQIADESDESEEDEDSDSSEEESDESEEEENSSFVPSSANALKDNVVVVIPSVSATSEPVNKPDQAANLPISTSDQEKPTQPITIPQPNNNTVTPPTPTPSPSSFTPSSTPIGSSPQMSKSSSSVTPNPVVIGDKSARPISKSSGSGSQKHKSLGATLTRTVTKTFSINKEDKTITADATPYGGSSGKTKKVKLTKEEKELKKKQKKEEKEKKKAEKDQKKSSKKQITKTLSLSEIKKPQQQNQTSSIKTFGIKLTQLVSRNNGDLPNILESCINILSNSEIVDVQQLFLDSTTESYQHVKEIKQRSDVELVDFSKVSESPKVMAAILVLFFSELPQPLINSKYYNDLIEINDITNQQVKLDDLKSLITSLSQLRRSVLQLIITFFQSKYINSPANASHKTATVQILAKCFGPLLIRASEAEQSQYTPTSHIQLSSDILRLIIENYVFIFEKTAEQNDIKFTHSQDGKLIITEASIDKLIDKATDYYYLYNERYFSLTFFITHLYFIQPNELVDKLITLFKENHVDSKKKWKAERRSKKASCISDSVKLWVDYCYKELREDKKLAQKIIKGFPHLEASISSRLSPSRFAISDILKVPKFGGHNRTRSASFSETFLTNPSSKDFPSAAEIAEQCTLVDYDLFANVRITDWVRLVQNTVDPSTAPTLASALKKSTIWCQWAMGEILSCEDKAQRATIITLLVDIALHCRELANFNTSISIYNALVNHHVKRLSQTWELVPKETMAKIQQLETSIQMWTSKIENPQAMFNNICTSINSACVPHFSLLRSILQQLDTKIPTKTSDGLINADKLRIVFGVVVDIQRLQQQRNYSIKPNKLFIQLQDINTMTMDELADASLKCEPPVSQKPVKKFDSPDSQAAALDWKQSIIKTHSKPLPQTSVGIDLPRLACNFIFKSIGADGGDVIVNNGNKIYDILQVLENLAKIVGTPEQVEKITTDYPQHIPLTTPPDSDIKRELLKFLDEVVGIDSSVVSILKLCNQAIIAPVVIELTLNICKGVPFMDAGGWKILVYKQQNSSISEDNSTANGTSNSNNSIIVKNLKKQKSMSTEAKDYFEFEWYLQMEMDQNCKSVLGFDMKISSLTFSTDTNQTIRDQLLDSFKNYLLNQECIKYINLNPDQKVSE